MSDVFSHPALLGAVLTRSLRVRPSEWWKATSSAAMDDSIYATKGGEDAPDSKPSPMDLPDLLGADGQWLDSAHADQTSDGAWWLSESTDSDSNSATSDPSDPWTSDSDATEPSSSSGAGDFRYELDLRGADFGEAHVGAFNPDAWSDSLGRDQPPPGARSGPTDRAGAAPPPTTGPPSSRTGAPDKGAAKQQPSRPPAGIPRAPPPQAKVGPKKRRRQCTHRGLDFDVAYGLLIGTGPEPYKHRPYRLHAVQNRQIFVERPPVRRQWGGGDRWRNSGGQRGGTVVWINKQHGVRKRYGTLVREGGRRQLKFQQFTLVTRESDAPDGLITEISSAYVYAVEGCAADDVEDELPEEPPKPTKTKGRGRSRPRKKAAAKAVGKDTVSSIDKPALQEVKAEPAAVQQQSSPGDKSRVAVLDFAPLVGNRGSKRAHSSESPDGEWPGEGRARKWPLGKATLAAASLMVLAVVMCFVGALRLLEQQPQPRFADPADSSGCPAGTYRPRSELLADCLVCTDCSQRGLFMLVPCGGASDTVCGGSTITDQLALLALKATQPQRITMRAPRGESMMPRGMAGWSPDGLPCTQLDTFGRGWPGCQCDSIGGRVVSFSASVDGVDVTAPFDIGLLTNLDRLVYLSLFGKQQAVGDIEQLRCETPLFAPFILKMHQFTKTGSGQT